jgi:serine protease Do
LTGRRFLYLTHFLALTLSGWLIFLPCDVSANDRQSQDLQYRNGCPDLIDLVKELTPAVVNISIERTSEKEEGPQPTALFPSLHPLIESRLGTRNKMRTDTLGSGFICNPNGNIITNAHVVESAERIVVTLSSGKVTTGRLVSVHPDVDLAVINITPPYTLSKARIGDSEKIQVGEWVIAVGNPFGLGSTVTIGIISGKGRFLGIGPEDDFIQTDASINPGNSGGPLFNMTGEVIGVNTAIIAAGKGIGFSIPSKHINDLLEGKANSARSLRAWLGIYVQERTDDPGKQQEDFSRGVVVDEVLEGAPAYDAGILKGDIILDAAGHKIRDGRHLSKIIGSLRPGDLVKMLVQRADREHSFDIVLGKSPE